MRSRIWKSLRISKPNTKIRDHLQLAEIPRLRLVAIPVLDAIHMHLAPHMLPVVRLLFLHSPTQASMRRKSPKQYLLNAQTYITTETPHHISQTESGLQTAKSKPELQASGKCWCHTKVDAQSEQQKIRKANAIFKDGMSKLRLPNVRFH